MKLNKNAPLLLLALGLIFAISACRSGAEETTVPKPAAVNRSSLVSATGKVIPEQEALLSLSAGGVIENVLVQKGDRVESGQVLMQLEGSEQQAALVSATELELANAQFALDKLYKDTDLMAAEALRSAETAEEALEDLYNTEQLEALAIDDVARAERAVDTTERALTTLTNKPSQEAIDQAYSNMLLAEKKLSNTQEDIADVEWKLKKYSASSSLPDDIRKTIVKNLRQALKGLEIQRTQNQLALNRAETKYNDLLDPPDATDVSVAETNYLAAKALLQQAQRDLERVMGGPDAGDVAVLETQIEKSYRDYETYSAGPDPDDVALAELRISNAETQVAAAKENLADLVLAAPFEGVISEVYVNTSEWLTPGSPVMLLADLDHLQVETTDLGEIDVAQIHEGNKAIVTFDAFPELVLEGTIIRIAPKAAPGSGVNYPVTIELSEVPVELRWGMTAFVDIELE